MWLTFQKKWITVSKSVHIHLVVYNPQISENTENSDEISGSQWWTLTKYKYIVKSLIKILKLALNHWS